MDEWFQGKLMKDRKLEDFRKCRCCGRRSYEVNLWDEIIDDELHKQIYNVGFQKGKLEQKKGELEFLYSLKSREDGNKVCINYSTIMNKIKQLQKEIEEEN